jgi:hypothetical protein
MRDCLLSDSSPCVDAGDTAVSASDPEDSGNPGRARFPARGGLRNDMGAYGGPGSSALPSGLEEPGPTPHAAVPLVGLVIGKGQLALRCVLPGFSGAVLTVIDASGRPVRTLRSPRSEREHRFVWDGRDAQGRDAGAGVYFGRLRASGFTGWRRLLLVR